MFMNAKILLLMALAAAGPMLGAGTNLTEVVAEGYASGERNNAREQALTDALREAVRSGAGTDLRSETKITDFALEYDRVFAAAFGYVREYHVISSGLGDDGLYRIKVRAKVGAGQPQTNDVLALRQIVHLKGSPRVALEVEEEIEGMPSHTDFSRTWFEQTSREGQLQLVDLQRMKQQEDRLAARDMFHTNTFFGRIRQAALGQKADIILEVRMKGKYLGAMRLYGMNLVHRFSLAVDLRVVVPDTGNNVVTLALPGVEVSSGLEDRDTAAREAIHKLLAGAWPGQRFSAHELFRKMFAHWITELDLGTMVSMEFAQLADAEKDRLTSVLRGESMVNAVLVREFDSKGLSKIEVETRLDADGLKAAVLKALGNQFDLELATKHFLSFARKPASPKPSPPSPPQKTEAPPISIITAETPRPNAKTGAKDHLALGGFGSNGGEAFGIRTSSCVPAGEVGRSTLLEAPPGMATDLTPVKAGSHGIPWWAWAVCLGGIGSVLTGAWLLWGPKGQVVRARRGA